MTPEHAIYEALAKEMLRRCFADEEPADIHQWLTEQLGRLGGAADDQAAMYWLPSFDVFDAIMERRIQDAAIPAAQRRLLDWKWQTWNSYIDPMEPGMLAVISAGDGMGKTIYAEECAEHWAKTGHRVVFVHYELNRELMLDRRVARNTSIERRILKSGILTPEQMARLQAARIRLREWEGNITYLHTPGWTAERTTAELRKLRADGLCEIAIIDYLEKTAPSTRQLRMYGTNHFQREADNVEQLKTLGESLDMPILMLAQMSKAGKTTAADSLDRTGMRGAGEKSERANVVVLLHREYQNDETGYSPTVNVRIDKNTIGRTGAFQQYMEAKYVRVTDTVEVRL